MIRRLLACVLGACLIGCAAPGTHRHERAGLAIGVTVDAPVVYQGERIEPGLFDEALVSWDLRVPRRGAARLEARVRHGEIWTEWMTLAFRGDREVDGFSEPLRRGASARVDVDVIVCESPADAVEWRIVTLGSGPVEFGSVWVTTTRIGVGGGGGSVRGGAEPELLDHAVPHRAQADGGEGLDGRLCSPTAVAMVVASRGVDVTVAEMARRVHDDEFDLYGNWVNNTLAASELGVPMHVTRIGSWEEAAVFMRRGPIVISLPPFEERELPEAGYSSASGHLIVLHGFDGRGGVLVRDPAYGDESEAARVYRRDRLARLWLIENKGTAYVLSGD